MIAGETAPLRNSNQTSFAPSEDSPRIPKAVSFIWNAFVISAWAILFMACFFVVADPAEPAASMPLPVLILSYPVLLGICFTTIAYLLLYKRYASLRYGVVARMNKAPLKLRILIGCIVAAGASFILAVAIYNAFL